MFIKGAHYRILYIACIVLLVAALANVAAASTNDERTKGYNAGYKKGIVMGEKYGKSDKAKYGSKAIYSSDPKITFPAGISSEYKRGYKAGFRDGFRKGYHNKRGLYPV